ncbi:MAG: hypothetical protein AB7N76_05660 [Planctomycetota bacterium]
MSRTREALFGFVLGVTCAYHLGVGLVSCLAPETTLHFASWFYDVHATAVAPQVVYMLKALGMYALFTGGLLALAMTDPRRFRHVVLAAAALLVMRATTRVLFFPVLHEAFNVEWSRNLVNVGILLVQAGVLAGFCPAPVVTVTVEPAPAAAPTKRRRRAAPAPSFVAEALASASARLPRAPLASASAVRSGVR